MKKNFIPITLRSLIQGGALIKGQAGFFFKFNKEVVITAGRVEKFSFW